ncbi:siderophore-interacting protein [Pendulispora albinea]|uniref:Siderophore-interacting protein n=1 Tax=Pendulispora albinea TaxID=2741071 RepID=A0ABZ2M6T7_9BACT
MASAESWVTKTLGRLLFREAEVTAVHALSSHFRRVELRGQGLRGAGWSAGDKVQVYLPDTGMRTYTPLRWSESSGTTELLIYAHGDGPGSRWSQTLSAGDRFQFMGPRRSLALRMDEPLVFFGDETSFAVAHALQTSGRTGALRCTFEVSHRAESDDVLRALGLPPEEHPCFERSPGDTHLLASCETLRRAIAARPGARLVLTGRAQSIQRLRALLRGGDARPPSTVKAYWSVGRKGLD